MAISAPEHDVWAVCLPDMPAWVRGGRLLPRPSYCPGHMWRTWAQLSHKFRLASAMHVQDGRIRLGVADSKEAWIK